MSQKKTQFKLSSAIISAFTEAMHDLQQKENQRKLSGLTDHFRRTEHRKNLKKNKQISAENAIEERKYRIGEQYKLMDSHRIGIKELQERYLTNIQNGLTQQVVDLKLKKMKNILQKITKKSVASRFISQFFKIYHILILLSSILSLILYLSNEQYQMLITAIVLFIFAILSSYVSIFLQRKDYDILENIDSILPKKSTVIRNKEEINILSIDLVQGDIIKLDQGMICPADVRILASTDLYIDKQIYTGKTDEIYCHPECMNKENPLTTTNIIFLGSKITNGKALGIVIQTGTETLIQDLAYKCSQEDYFPDSQFKKDFDNFLNYLSLSSFGIGIIILLINLIMQRKLGINNYLLYSIGILVSTLPLGILLLKTLYISIIQRKLFLYSKVQTNYGENLVVLGQSSCICLDMTGMITMNKYVVNDIWYDDKARQAQNAQLITQDEYLDYNIKKDKTLQSLMDCAVLCNDAYFNDNLPSSIIKEVKQDKLLSLEQKKEKLLKLQYDYTQQLKKKNWIDWPCIGEQVDIALIKFFQPLKDIRIIRKQQPIIEDSSTQKAKIQFSQQSCYQCVICSNIQEKSYFTLYTKGSPHVVWNMCDKVFDKGKVVEKSNKWEVKFDKILNYYGQTNLRLVAFAKLDLSKKIFKQNTDIDIKEINFPINSQIFLGLIAFEDPINYQNINIIQQWQNDGRKIIMMTGEDMITASQIAKQSHIINTQTQFDLQKELNMPFENAMIDAQALVINGDQLAKQIILEEGLPDKQKGKILEKWLKKKEIIFTRIQPSHKIYIIKALKKLNHIVASTGKDSKDSPHLRFSDVGISFGIQGDQIARDASDMILMDDSLYALDRGIREGKLIYENLKKSIFFILASSVPQIMAFVFCFLAAIPYALNPLQVFIMDLGIIHLPALLYVHLQKEDIYLIAGICASAAGFLSFFMVLQDFGMPFQTMINVLGKKIYQPIEGDEYDSTSPWLGNSLLRDNYPCDSTNSDYENELGTYFDWFFHQHLYFDFRLGFAKCNKKGQWILNFDQSKDNVCDSNLMSDISERPLCFTTEILKFAQTSYLFSSSVVIMFNYILCKTKTKSILQDQSGNFYISCGIFFQIFTLLIFNFVPPLYLAQGTRIILFRYYGFYGIPFGIFLLILDEIRKFLIRKQLQDLKEGKIKEQNKQEQEKNSSKDKNNEEKGQLLSNDKIQNTKEEENNLIQRKQKDIKYTYIKQEQNTWILRHALI